MKKIFYKYSKCETLEPISGDRITEIMNIKAIEEAGFKVDYNGKVISQDFGIAYIRANEKYFRQAEGIKRIWFASPYNAWAMGNADRIATFTDVWTERLRLGIRFNLNPDGIAWGNKVITIPQTVNTSFFEQKKQADKNKLLFCITGKISDTTYPKTFFDIWPSIKKLTGGEIVVIARDVKEKFVFNSDTVLIGCGFNEMPDTLSKMNLMIAGQHGEEWEYCGNMKILEAAAIGVPIIMERSEAREEDFGFEYPLFVPRGTMTEPDKAPYLIRAIETFLEFRNIADPWLKIAAYRHHIKKTSLVILKEFNNLMK